jgi:hypothetical protein
LVLPLKKVPGSGPFYLLGVTSGLTSPERSKSLKVGVWCVAG